MSKKSGKEKHPLFNAWSGAKRTSGLSKEWREDFWLFVSEVGERLTDHRLFTIDKEKPLSKDNFKWVPIKLKLQDYSSKADYMKAYMKANPDKQKDHDLKRHFGITISHYTTMQTNQKGLCAICGKTDDTIDNRSGLPRNLAVDHCHITKLVRGLLCRGCNQGLGNFKDDADLLQKAINYLKVT